MLKSIIAKNAKKNAIGIAVLIAAVSFGSFLHFLISKQMSQVDENHSRAIKLIHSIRNDSLNLLFNIKSSVSAACTESNLQVLRKAVLISRVVSDIGIYDEQGLQCSTLRGLMNQPEPSPPVDVHHTFPNGTITLTSFNIPVFHDQSNPKSTLTRSGKFGVTIYPQVVDDVMATGVSVFRIIAQDRSITTIATQKGYKEWLAPLQSIGNVRNYPTQFDLNHMSIVSVSEVPETQFVIQTVVPIKQFFNSNRTPVMLSLLLSILVATLTYYALKPVFLRWKQLEYRIDNLLTINNLVCVYQPIIDLTNGKPCGCEVLMRLRDGQNLLAPDVALAAIIHRRLTWKLDQLVARKAIGELAAYLPDVSNFKVAFNCFPENIKSDALVNLFDEILQLTPHSGLKFDIEVLEQEFQGKITKEIQKLRAASFLISVDDFGTGYSNLRSIKALSPDFLKIDRSFIHDIEDNSIRSSLIPEIISIGRAVNSKIIAEGVENSAQRDKLIGLGVDYAQGYFFARPQEIGAFSSYMSSFKDCCGTQKLTI